MEHAAINESSMIAYCIGKPEVLALGTNHFDRTLSEICQVGHEVWCVKGAAGIVHEDDHWYIWVKKNREDGHIEGRIYESSSVDGILNIACMEFDWMSVTDKIEMARRIQRESRSFLVSHHH